MTRDEAIFGAIVAALPSRRLDYDDAGAIVASLASSGYAVVPVEATATHKKRGTTYDLLGDAFLQTEVPLSDMNRVVVYRCRETGEYWVRRYVEFYDGRFILAAAQEDSHE